MREKMRELVIWAFGVGAGVMLTVCCYEIASSTAQTIELPIKGTVVETEVENVTDHSYWLEVYVEEAD